MALREIREIGDPILEKTSKVVKDMTPRIITLIEDILNTRHEADGVGLAAVQVGILKRIFIVEVDEEHKYTFINPKLISVEGEQTGYEGCLSVPGKTGQVTRPNKVVVEALDENMTPFTVEAEELLARAILHENDHLDGHLYTEIVEGELYDAGSEPDDEEYDGPVEEE